MQNHAPWAGHANPRPSQHPAKGSETGTNSTPARLHLLSYNIQVGIPGESLRKSITGGWRHILPHATRQDNLGDIADLISAFDIVALQEVDAGSIRSNYINQIEYLAHLGGFPYWYWQLNRSLGRFAQQCNGVLSRYSAHQVDNHKLPGLIPGRGAMALYFGTGDEQLLVIALHLSLSRRARHQQLAYIADLIQGYPHVIVMGDMNSPCYHLMTDSPLKNTDLIPVNEHQNTFPSWRPSRNLDHFFVTPSLTVESVSVLNHPYSDHLPITLDVTLPPGVIL